MESSQTGEPDASIYGAPHPPGSEAFAIGTKLYGISPYDYSFDSFNILYNKQTSNQVNKLVSCIL